MPGLCRRISGLLKTLRPAISASMCWWRVSRGRSRLIVLARATDAVSVTETAPLQATDAATASVMRERILAALPGDRLDLLRDFVRECVVRVLRRDPADPPDRHDRLTDLGFDSLMAVQLRGQLSAGLAFDTALPATLMFDYPTIDKLAVYLLQRLRPEEARFQCGPRNSCLKRRRR